MFHVILHPEEDANSTANNMLLETNLKLPILQVAVGNFSRLVLNLVFKRKKSFYLKSIKFAIHKVYSKEVQSVILISLVYSILTIKVNYLGTKFVMQNTRLFVLIKGQLISKCLFIS